MYTQTMMNSHKINISKVEWVVGGGNTSIEKMEFKLLSALC